jgi:serine/threonine-protein kinase RsbW
MPVRERRFSGDVRAPSDARRAVREALRGAVSPRTLGDAELLVSELTTNSIRHADDGELSMEAAVRRDKVRVRVCDAGEGFEARRRPGKADLEEAGGYGLVLLDRLADDWGVLRGDRFCVWFELERR